MSDDMYNKSIKTGELQLSLYNKFSHYSIVGFCFIGPILFPVLHIIDYLNGYSKPILTGEYLFIFIPLIIGLLFFRLQKKRLKFKIVETNLKHEEILKVIKDIGSELEWIFIHKDSKIYLARTNPSWLSGSWGEQITILFDQNRILVNSICDLDKQTSVVSFGRNRRNENTLIEAIEKANELSGKN